MDTATKRALGTVVKASMKRYQVPGVSIGIWHDGTEYLAGYGVTNIEFPLPVDNETLFQIGSTTKTITGTLVMQLVEEGIVNLEDPVRKHLPKFRLSDETAAKKVRIKHLVTHLGGWRGDYFKDTGRGSNALARSVTGMRREVPQLTPVGTLWAYNNAGFHVLGRIIEVLRKKPYEEVVNERIFEPLGMSNSYFFSEDIITHKTALGHLPSAEGIKIARPFGLPRAVNPAGGVTSTAADQIRWARFHLGHDLGPDAKEVLSRRYIKQMQTSRHKVKSSFEEVGITWFMDRVGGTQVVRHGGSINGQMSAFLFVPKHDFAITVLTNGALGSLLGSTVTKWCFERLLGLTAPEPATRRLRPADASRYSGTY
ncbi:MAG: beta-lactamase family protein, partial [Actinobacteria bacterium]|nr:beta-lactamase family protein [Actinomycetota bacterium]